MQLICDKTPSGTAPVEPINHVRAKSGSCAGQSRPSRVAAVALGIIWRSNLLSSPTPSSSSSACAANKLPLPWHKSKLKLKRRHRLRHGLRAAGARVAIVQDHHEMGLNRTKMFVSVNEKAKSAAKAGQA